MIRIPEHEVIQAPEGGWSNSNWSTGNNNKMDQEPNQNGIGDHTLNGFKSLKNVRLHILEVFDPKAETDQVVMNPIYGSFWLWKVPIER